MNHLCLAAAEELAKEGKQIEVIDPRTVSPLDSETIVQSVRKTGRLLVVDEPAGPCGFAAEVAALVVDRAFDHLDAPVRRITGVAAPTPYSPVLEQTVLPDQVHITQALRALVEE